MPKSRILLGACAVLLAGAAVRADEPHLEMIRGLRAQGEPALAMEYIQTRIGTNVPADIAQVLQLEIARTRVELALHESEEGKRLAMFAAARGEFENFLKNNADHPLAPQASFEIARLIASQGKEQLNRARRQEGDKARQQKALELARPLFADAVTKLEAAGKVIKAQLGKYANPAGPEEKATARDLQNAYLQAQLEQGINYYLLAQSFGDNEQKQRGDALFKAMGVLDRLASEDAKQPACWLARAWYGRCQTDMQDFPKAKDAFAAIFAEKGPSVDAAQRVAGYFRMLMLNAEGQTKSDALAQQARDWLNRYRAYQNTPEGYGVRYFLASQLEGLAEAGIIRDRTTGRPSSVSGAAAAFLREADALLRGLTETENDFSERAASKRMRVILGISLSLARDRDPDKLNTFEGCYLLALLEIADLNDKLSKEKLTGEDGQKLRLEHYLRVLRALERGLQLVKPTDPAKEVLDARNLQVFANLVVGRNYEAAVLGEHLARSLTRSSKGAIAAQYSLQAYKNVLIEAKSRGGAFKEIEERTDREQIRRMAQFMEQTWPNDAPTDAARHQLGSLLVLEGDWLGALEAFARVTASYANLAFLRTEQGMACYRLQLARDDGTLITPAVKKNWYRRVVADLEKMPELALGADGETANAYCLARLQLGYLLQQEGTQYAQAESVAKSLLEQMPKYTTLEERQRSELTQGAQALRLHALYGQVYERVKSGDHAKAAQLYMPVVSELKKAVPPEDAVKVRKAMSDLLQLAVRSSVTDDKLDRAQELLKYLEQTSSGQAGASGPLVQILREVQTQINEMKRHDPARLKDTVDRFASFLEQLAKQPNLSTDVRIFLALGFDSLDQPGRAVELLTEVTRPPAKDFGAAPVAPPEPADDAADEVKKKYEADKEKYEVAKAKHDKERNDHDNAVRSANFAQLARARALRHQGRLETDKSVAAQHFAAADKLVDQMIGTAKDKGWGYDNLEVRREKIFILEDSDRYRDALAAWQAMQKPFIAQLKPNPSNDREEKIREVVYEIRFYQNRLFLKSYQKIAKPEAKADRIRVLAENIVKLERDKDIPNFGGMPVKKLYREWLENEEQLREAYKRAGGMALVGDGEAARANSGPQ